MRTARDLPDVSLRSASLNREEPIHSNVQDFYDNDYYRNASPAGRVSWHERAIVRRLGDLNGKSVLDVACGTGEWLAELGRSAAQVSGVDISLRAVETCQERLPDADIRQSVAESLPFETGSFDLVTCLGSLEHFIDQPAALREMVRVAKSSAAVLILVPNAGFLTRRLGLYRGTQQLAIRETVRSVHEWRAMLQESGLKVEALWKDLHVLDRKWIARGNVLAWPLRVFQATALPLWPLQWQYQIYFHCRIGHH